MARMSYLQMRRVAGRHMYLGILLQPRLTTRKAIPAAVTFVAGIKSSACCGPITLSERAESASKGYLLISLVWIIGNTSAYHRP